ncbi:MAG: glycoside hydrolase family 15 protein [Planctomycetota bacterium]|nr:glycoside hydrolase family 15 protein [Planctomycetota bacterium]
MPRDIPVGNGQMLVTFDQHYQIRDLYFPHVGQENHAGGGPCRFGVWSALKPRDGTAPDRRRQRLYWSDQGWNIKLRYQAETMATDVTMSHPDEAVELHCTDVVDFHRPVLIRRIEVRNQADYHREVHLFHHQDFNMYGAKVGDTVYYDPQLRCLIHYRNQRYVMATWHADGELRIDEYATGTAGFQGAEGTWRDAEDGHLGNNAIAQGAVDSTMMIQVSLPPGGSRVVYMVIGAGQSRHELEEMHKFLHRETPQGVIDRTTAYWRLWLAAAKTDFASPESGGPSPRAIDLFKRSLLVVRSQIDNATGSIIAANDSDIMQFSRDTYSYLWPRDGALVASSLDDAGFPDVARSFYSLCSKIITDDGYFLHKYNPDGSPASSWHPWVSKGNPQLPIQEDETALVLWAVWRHYRRYRDIEFVRPLWVNLITKAADFLVRFRDPDTKLPLPSYDLWEERWGVHAFTVATVYAGLQAAWQFAVCFGDTKKAQRYGAAAQEVREAFCKHMWSEEHGRFLRRIVPLDHDRTARLMAEVMAGRTPLSDGQQAFESIPARLGRGNGNGNGNGNGTEAPGPAPTGKTPAYERDTMLDSSMFAIHSFGLVPVHDPRVEKTMSEIAKKLWLKTSVGGLARYEGDTYFRHHYDPERVPGNPWFICTLWLADWHIAKAKSAEELREALPIIEWVAAHALPSGVLAEQVHPLTNAPLSVSPLTWSHASVIATLMALQERMDHLDLCPTCGQARQCTLPDIPQVKLAV